jgi:hypothetical protein
MVRQRVLMVKLIVYSLIFMYSAMKNRVNGPAAYSMLNPDATVRSNGALLVSASVEINHIIAGGHVGMMSQICSCVVISEDIVNDPFMSITDKTMMARDTSYEIVCATARSAPIRAYLEFDDQPDHRMA